jgi:transposase
VRVRLSDGVRGDLLYIVRQRSLPNAFVDRARIILRLEIDPCVCAAAAALGVSVKFVRRWRGRFLATSRRRIEQLVDRPRSGRPVRIDAVSRCELVAMACGSPADAGERDRDVWTIDSLRSRFVAKHPKLEISRTSVLRILTSDGIRPHRIRLWLHSPDPDFRRRVTEICELYLNPPKDSVVLCVDEKTGMQALGRRHPLRLPSRRRAGRLEFEYVRNGTRALIAAFNTRTGEVFGQVRAQRGAADLVEFMEGVAERYPRQQIHVVWDNLNIHFDGAVQRWARFNRRHRGRFHFHYTPIHASWVNQVELFFSILHRRVLRYAAYDDARALTRAVSGFIERWNRVEKHPFRWVFKGYPSAERKAA